VTDQYKQAWNEAELDFRKYTNRMLESMDRKLDMISSQITELEKKLMRDKQVQALSPEPRDQLFAVLKEFADSEDPRASSVAQLAGFGRFDEATDMAIELARDDQAAVNQLEASTDEARKRAARRWIQAGDIAVVTDDAKASDAYLRAVTLDPSAIDGWWGLGFTSLSLDRLADALSAFTKLCHFMDGFARLARAAADPETAKQDFERFLKEEPNGSSAIYIRATRRLAEMFIYIAEILKRDPKLGYSWDMKVGDAPTEAKPGERVEYVARHPSEDEVRGITEWLSKSLHGFDGLLGEGAIRTEYSRALETLARIAIDHGHPDLALGYLDRAHQMSVEGADFVAEAVYLCNLGVAAAQMGQYSTAENHLDRSLAICEDDPSLGVRLIFPRRLLSPEEADRWKDRPRAQDDGLREGEIAMCNRLKDESERDSESAFRKGLKLKETEGNVHANLALVALRVGDPLKADREFRRAFDVHSEIGFLPGMAQDLEFYGHFAREQGDPKVACTCWEQALELFDQLGKRQHAQALKDHLRIVCNEGPVKSPPDTSD
jgi:tetratricopeptide (TPR) repeat protein